MLKLITRVGVLVALALAGVAASPAAAHADLLDSDEVTSIGATGYTFSGKVDFNRSAGNITPHVTGTLTLNNVVGDCARIEIEYVHDLNHILTIKHGGSVCAADNGRHNFSVDLQPYTSNQLEYVYLNVEKLTEPGGEFESAQGGHSYSIDPPTDQVKITAAGFDFGDIDLLFGEPNGFGSLRWGIDDGQLVPHLDGFLHLNNVDGGCARMRLQYLSSSGSELAIQNGGTVCAHDKKHHKFSVALGTYKSRSIAKVTVRLQSELANGTYKTLGLGTVRADNVRNLASD